MIFKFYASIRNFTDPANRKSATSYYVDYMGASVIKEDRGHTHLRLFGKIHFYLHGVSHQPRYDGYHIIKFEDEEAAGFMPAVAKVKEAIGKGLGHLSIDVSAERWGTTIFEFVDPFGIVWDLEVSTKALEAAKS